MGGPLPKRPSTVSLSPRTLDGHHSSRCIASRICCTSCLVVSSSYGSFIFFGFRLVAARSWVIVAASYMVATFHRREFSKGVPQSPHGCHALYE